LLVLVSPLISHLEVIWEEPALEHLISRLAVCSRVVLFDRRGIGLSDRSPGPGEVAGLPRLAADAAAVLDSCGTRAAVLMGVTFGAQLAVQFAADYPDRTQALIRVGGWAKLTRILQFDFEADPGQIDAWVDAAARGWGTGAVLAAHAAAMRDSARYREWAARVERNTSSPGTVAAMLRWAARVDVRPLLGRLRAPTLVLHRADDRTVPVEHSTFLAEHIPGATLVALPGEAHTIFLGDQRPVIDAMVGFLDREVTDGALRAALRRADRRNASARGWRSLTPGGAGDRRTGRRRVDQRRDRGSPAHFAAYGRRPAAPGVRQAGSEHARRGHRRTCTGQRLTRELIRDRVCQPAWPGTYNIPRRFR
jgi:pimeloyl-ACP methyl ester carboxylesterase